MKAGAALIIVVGVAVIGAVSYVGYSLMEYERAVDDRVEREINDAELSIIKAQLLDHRGDTALYMRELYRGPASDEINRRYARLEANWLQAYPRLARMPAIPDRLTPVERLGAELDERLGPGVSAVMREEYDVYRRGAPQREAIRLAEEEEARRQSEALGRFFEEYYRQHGVYPEGVSRP